jgi:hypothetical protein
MRACFDRITLALLLSAVFASAVIFGQSFSATNPGFYWVAPGNCYSTISGNSTGTQGLTVSGASNTPVIQAGTSNVGTNTHTYICNITPPNGIVTTRTGFAIQDATVAYSVPTGSLGTQAATLGSGTMNSSIVFAYIAYPTPATGESASSVTPVRADSGNLVILPTVANFNVNTLTAGSFYTVRFTPATPIAWKTDLRQLLLTMTLQAPATTAVTTNVSGVLVRLVSN